MISTIIGKKLGQVQGFLENGARIPMTRIMVSGNVVSQIKTMDKEGYDAVQIGFDSKKKASKPLTGHSKKAGLTITPRFFRETRVDKLDGISLGQSINASEVLGEGDIVDVTGVSKGKGYAGVVKRHHFKGGPKTHGQSDRHRAPGSIGQSTTPGRVYKGKRMAGHMGVDRVTVKNLEVIAFENDIIFIKGLVPGPISSIVTITKRGTNKKHMGLFKVASEAVIDEAEVEEVGPSVEEQSEQREVTEKIAIKEEQAEAFAKQVANQDVTEKKEEKTMEEAKSEDVKPEVEAVKTEVKEETK